MAPSRLGTGTARRVSTAERRPRGGPPAPVPSAPPTSRNSGAPAWTACTQRFHTVGHSSSVIGWPAVPTQ